MVAPEYYTFQLVFMIIFLVLLAGWIVQLILESKIKKEMKAVDKFHKSSRFGLRSEDEDAPARSITKKGSMVTAGDLQFFFNRYV